MLPKIAIARAVAGYITRKAPGAARAFIAGAVQNDRRRELLELVRAIRAGVAVIAWAAVAGVIILAGIAAGVWFH